MSSKLSYFIASLLAKLVISGIVIKQPVGKEPVWKAILYLPVRLTLILTEGGEE